MKTTINKKLIIAIIALVIPVIGNSQQYPDSLLKYLELAEKNNPVVLQKFNEYEAAIQKIPQAGSLPDPELSAGIFLSPMELVNGNQIADFRLMQMFPWFGVLRNAKDEMSLMAKAKFEELRDAKLQVFYDVQSTLYELYKLGKEISISEKNRDILKLIERLALVKYKSANPANPATSSQSSSGTSTLGQDNNPGNSDMQVMPVGQGSPSGSDQQSSSMQNGPMGSSSGTTGLSDIYRIQIESGDLENNIALLYNKKSVLIAQFNGYLNRPVSTPVSTVENIASDSSGFDLKAVSDSMLTLNPMLGRINYEKQSLDARQNMVKRMGYPMVGLGLNYSLIGKTKYPMGPPSMNGRDMVMPMVVFTLPVYRKKYSAMQSEAELLKAAASENYKAAANALQTEYYKAVMLYRDAERRVKLYDNQSQLAARSFDLALKSFSTSSVSLAEVLRVRQQTLDYELKKVEADADYNTAIAWLKKLAGGENIDFKTSQ